MTDRSDHDALHSTPEEVASLRAARAEMMERERGRIAAEHGIPVRRVVYDEVLPLLEHSVRLSADTGPHAGSEGGST